MTNVALTGLARDLAKRAAEGKPVRIGVIGSGEMGTDLVTQGMLMPGIEVVKSGPAIVHHGDTMDFSFAVRSIGNTPLHDVKVTDDKCSPVSAEPVTKAGGDQDAVLEDGEVWTYTCTMKVPTHGASEMDPLCNIVTATGSDEQDNPVSDTDRHCTDIIHPAIQVKKVADRATAQVGDTIGYRFDVTNPGDTGLDTSLLRHRLLGSIDREPARVIVCIGVECS